METTKSIPSLSRIRENKRLQWIKKNLPAIFFVLGFLFDIFTLDQVDNLFSLIQQAIYMAITGILLRFSMLEKQGLWSPSEKLKKVWNYHNEAIHFFLGSLLSVYTLFYFLSSSLSVSLVFLVIMFAILVLNELPFFQVKGFYFKYILYSLCLFSFFLFLLPITIGSVGILAFVLSMFLSGLLNFFNYKDLIKRGINKGVAYKQVLFPGLAVGTLILVLYILKVLPPVPLSAKYMGIFHSVDKTSNEYQLGYSRSIWKFWQNGDQSFEYKDGDKIFCFASIFAPSSIEEKVFFHWEQFGSSGWQTTDRVPIKIRGGREKGYRGYVSKLNFTEGEWRVKLETEDGREISRISFEVFKSLTNTPHDIKFKWFN